jgi:hypothetical protein
MALLEYEKPLINYYDFLKLRRTWEGRPQRNDTSKCKTSVHDNGISSPMRRICEIVGHRFCIVWLYMGRQVNSALTKLR